MKKQRKSTKSALKRRADKIFSEKIRSKGYCFMKGEDNVECGGSLQCAHIVGRANHNLRWDSANAIPLCAGHHIYYTSRPTEFALIISSLIPTRWEYLREHRNEIWDKDIERVLEELEDWRP